MRLEDAFVYVVRKSEIVRIYNEPDFPCTTHARQSRLPKAGAEPGPSANDNEKPFFSMLLENRQFDGEKFLRIPVNVLEQRVQFADRQIE